MKPYPKLGSVIKPTVEDHARVLEVIIKERPSDIKDFDNLSNVFVSGRKVARIPSGASDVLPTDKVGDINYTTSFLYILVDNAGTATWRRVALSSW